LIKNENLAFERQTFLEAVETNKESFPNKLKSRVCILFGNERNRRRKWKQVLSSSEPLYKNENSAFERQTFLQAVEMNKESFPTRQKAEVKSSHTLWK
jgi:hypothetical protein